jgi:hypothetical protein
MARADRVSHMLTDLEDKLRQIGRSWPNRGWSWDERNGCVASSFASSDQSSYESVLMQILVTRWDHRTIARAPAAVAHVAKHTGGLRPGQLLFAPAECDDTFPYALWWPWGDDTTISVRIALAPDEESSRAMVRDAFGVDLDG